MEDEIISLNNEEQMALLYAIKKILERKSLSKDRKKTLKKLLMRFTFERKKVLKIKFGELR